MRPAVTKMLLIPGVDYYLDESDGLYSKEQIPFPFRNRRCKLGSVNMFFLAVIFGTGCSVNECWTGSWPTGI